MDLNFRLKVVKDFKILEPFSNFFMILYILIHFKPTPQYAFHHHPHAEEKSMVVVLLFIVIIIVLMLRRRVWWWWQITRIGPQSVKAGGLASAATYIAYLPPSSFARS